MFFRLIVFQSAFDSPPPTSPMFNRSNQQQKHTLITGWGEGDFLRLLTNGCSEREREKQLLSTSLLYLGNKLQQSREVERWSDGFAQLTILDSFFSVFREERQPDPAAWWWRSNGADATNLLVFNACTAARYSSLLPTLGAVVSA